MGFLCTKVGCTNPQNAKGGWKNERNRDEHEEYCPDGKSCHLDPPCDKIIMSKSMKSKHCHFECEVCGAKVYTTGRRTDHQALHPEWGIVYAKALEDVMNNNEETIQKAEVLFQEYQHLLILPKESDKKALPYIILRPTDSEPLTLRDFIQLLVVYFGKSSLHSKSGLTERMDKYRRGKDTSQALADFINSFADSNEKPVFYSPFGPMSDAEATNIEKLFLFTVAPQNLLNTAHGEGLTPTIAKWKKEKLALLGAHLLKLAFENYCKSFGSVVGHMKLSLCQYVDARLSKVQADEKQEVEVSSETFALMNKLGYGNFETFFIDGKLVVEPKVNFEANRSQEESESGLVDPQPLSNTIKLPSRKRKYSKSEDSGDNRD